MLRLDNILEQWAHVYKPLSHQLGAEAKRKTFYRIDTINNNNEFVQNYNIAPSPCMAYSTLVDAAISRTRNGFVSYRHSIYFLVKQVAPANNAKTTNNDAMAATEAKFDGDEMVQDLLAFLFLLKNAAIRTLNRANNNPLTIPERMAAKMPDDELKGIQGLQLDNSEWGTMPMRYNGWWICGLEIEQLVPRNTCVLETRYHQP